MANSKKTIETKQKAPVPAGKDLNAGREVRAVLRFLRMSPRKVAVIAGAVRRMPAGEAVDYLKLVNKAASLPVRKLISSAIANGENNFEMTKDNLYIKKITVNQGPTLKRYQPRAFGRAGLIRKKTSHVEVVLGEITPTVLKKKSEKKAQKAEEVKIVAVDEVKKTGTKTPGGTEGPTKTGKAEKGVSKKIFSRKTG